MISPDVDNVAEFFDDRDRKSRQARPRAMIAKTPVKTDVQTKKTRKPLPIGKAFFPSITAT